MVDALRIPRRLVDITVGEASGEARSFAQFECDFEAKSWARPKPNEGEVKLYNLSEDSIRYLERPNMVLKIEAGSDVAGQLFQGAIGEDDVITKSAGPDWVTTVKAADGRRAYRDTLFIRSYPRATPSINVIRDVASAMGKPVSFVGNPPDFVFAEPLAFSEKARSALDMVLAVSGLQWSIINGVIFILSQGQVIPGNAPVISPASGLHGSPERTKKGVKFKSDLNPAIIAGKASILNADLLRGTYKNEEVKHAGSTKGGNRGAKHWVTMAQGVKI